MATPTNEEMLGMSDEDFSNLNAPPADPNTPENPAGSSETETVEEETTTAENASADAGAVDTATPEKAAVAAAEENTETPETGSTETAPVKVETANSEETQPGADTSTTDSGSAPASTAEKTGTEEKSEKSSENTSGETDTQSESIDYEAAYKRVMAPFKANGKTIEPRSPEEVIQLMQMGANYTRKLQELQPHRKIVMMLQNNDLLDEGKLSYLIDLDKKNPEAIKKLIKDSGLDPLEIDTEVEPAYLPGSHAVSDEEANFRTVMEDIRSSPSGTETLTEIHRQWDQASKDALWKSPDIMSVIHEQRASGVYDLIKAEMDRQITLGAIPANTPFLEAYKTVGDAMVAATNRTPGQGQQVGATQETGGSSSSQVVATRAAAPKSPLANGDKAQAASPTRAAPKKAEVFVNPLSQSDEEFLKTMDGRV